MDCVHQPDPLLKLITVRLCIVCRGLFVRVDQTCSTISGLLRTACRSSRTWRPQSAS